VASRRAPTWWLRWREAWRAAPGRAIQLGGKWTDGTGVTENDLFVDGRLHKIGDELRWSYDRADWLRPWRISGEGVVVGRLSDVDAWSRVSGAAGCL
jgi:hypothetical protein